MGKLINWLKGLLIAAISSTLIGLTTVMADPDHFSPFQPGGLKKLGPVLIISAATGVQAYMMKSPLKNAALSPNGK